MVSKKLLGVVQKVGIRFNDILHRNSISQLFAVYPELQISPNQ
jgi:hypothetical protein